MKGQVRIIERGDLIGVLVGDKPVGRIRPHGAEFRAFTNRRAPGEGAYLGTYRSVEVAAERVAAEHR